MNTILHKMNRLKRRINWFRPFWSCMRRTKGGSGFVWLEFYGKYSSKVTYCIFVLCEFGLTQIHITIQVRFTVCVPPCMCVTETNKLHEYQIYAQYNNLIFPHLIHTLQHLIISFIYIMQHVIIVYFKKDSLVKWRCHSHVKQHIL